jgi:hypothetical protein
MNQPLPELWQDCMGDFDTGEEASGLGQELELCWNSLVTLRDAVQSDPDPVLWTQALEQTVTCLKMLQDTYATLAVDPEHPGFALRFQQHFELETLGLEELGGEFLFCDPHTVLVHGACAILERRIVAMGRAIADAMSFGDREALEREVTSCGYGILRAMEEVAVVVLEQLPLDTSSRSMVPGFRCALKDLLDWLEVLRALEQFPSDQTVDQALTALSSSEAVGALNAYEIKEVQQYQDLRVSDLEGLRAIIETKPMVELAISKLGTLGDRKVAL